MDDLGPLVRVQSVRPLKPFEVMVTFRNGVERQVNLEPYLRGPIFEPIRNDPEMFRAVKVVGSTIGWDNGADIDPDVLYYELTPANANETETTGA